MIFLSWLDRGEVSCIADLSERTGVDKHFIRHTLKFERKYVRYTLRLAFLSPRDIHVIMQGQEPNGLSLAALRTTLAAASQRAFSQSIFLTRANWSEQERFLGLDKLSNGG